MALAASDARRWALLSVLTFADGGEQSFMVLCRGTVAECDAAAERIPAVTYSGNRPVREASLVIVPEEALADGAGGE